MHPVDFARDVLKENPWEKQEEALALLHESDRVAIKSGHGVGKTWVSAAAAVHFICEYSPALVLTTAPTFRQVEKIIWPEIRKFMKRTPYMKFQKRQPDQALNRTELRLCDDPIRTAIGFATKDPDSVPGFHCPNLLVIADEACGIPDEIYDVLFGFLTSENNKLLLIGNPTAPEGLFYRAHAPGSEFKCMSISSLESPNVLAGKVVVPGLTSRNWVEQMAREWGEDSPTYKARVLGEFPDSAEDALVPRSWVEAASLRGAADLPEIDRPSLRMGVDVARFGTDKTVFIIRDKHAIRYMEEYNGLDLMHTAGRVKVLHNEWKIPEDAIAIDGGGLGGGVPDALHQENIAVNSIEFGSRALDSEHFANIRCEMYWTLRSALDPAKGATFAISAEFDMVARELIQPHYTFTSSAQIKIEPKDKIKKRLGRSPDHSDALALTFAPMPASMKIDWV